jgi:hypothetical protein
MKIVLLAAVFLFAWRLFLFAHTIFRIRKSSLVEALPQKRKQFCSRMKMLFRTRIHLLDPPFEETFGGARLDSKSNYKYEFHAVDALIAFRTDLCSRQFAIDSKIGLKRRGRTDLTFPVRLSGYYRASSSPKRLAPVAIHRPAAPAGVTIRIRKAGLSQVAGKSEIWPSKWASP